MANFRVVGPLNFNLPAGGLAPGQSTPTFWTTDPHLGKGTVQFTVLPDFAEMAAAPNPGGITLATRNPAVQWSPKPSPVGGTDLSVTLHVEVVNVGPNTANTAQMFISFIEE